MKKDSVFALRMTKTVREALNKAAKKDCRSVSSMLDKIITDYLIKGEFLEDLPHFQLCFEPPLVEEEFCFNCRTCHMMNAEGGSLVGASFSNPEGTNLQRE